MSKNSEVQVHHYTLVSVVVNYEQDNRNPDDENIEIKTHLEVFVEGLILDKIFVISFGSKVPCIFFGVLCTIATIQGILHSFIGLQKSRKRKLLF